MLSPKQFKQLITDHIPAERVCAVQEFRTASNHKCIRIVFYQCRDGWYDLSVYLEYLAGEVSIHTYTHEAMKVSACLPTDKAILVGQALLDAAYIAEEVAKR